MDEIIKNTLVKFDEFIHKGEDGDDSPETWAWTLKGSYPIEVRIVVEAALREVWEKAYQDGIDEVRGKYTDD